MAADKEKKPIPSVPPLERITVDVQGLSALLSVSPGHIRNCDRRGLIPAARKLGKSRRWFVPEVLEFFASGCKDRIEWMQHKQQAKEIQK